MSKQCKNFPLFKSTAEMRVDFGRLTSRWSDESILNTRMLLWLCEHFEGKKKPKRKLTAWNAFLGTGLKSGKTIQQLAAEWKIRKANKAA